MKTVRAYCDPSERVFCLYFFSSFIPFRMHAFCRGNILGECPFRARRLPKTTVFLLARMSVSITSFLAHLEETSVLFYTLGGIASLLSPL